MWTRYLEALRNSPIRTNAATALCINLLGDVLAQNIEYSSSSTTVVDWKQTDWERTATVASFGMVNAGPAVYWFRWIDHQFPLVTKNRQGLFMLAKKLTVHLGIYAPTVNACFYGWIILKDRLFITNSQQSTATPSFLQEWYTKLERDLFETQKNSVKVWGTAQAFNFWVLPPHVRVLFSNFVMVAWTAYLSVVGHRKHKEVEWESVAHD